MLVTLFGAKDSAGIKFGILQKGLQGTDTHKDTKIDTGGRKLTASSLLPPPAPLRDSVDGRGPLGGYTDGCWAVEEDQ